MNVPWMFDKNLTEEQVKSILSDPEDKRFIEMAAILFERNNDPKYVFTFISKEYFVRHWLPIKKRMRTNNWNSVRIMYWQRVQKILLEDFKSKGVVFRGKRKPIDSVCAQVGAKIKEIRKKNGQTQKDLADAMNVSQQMISHIESGHENLSILTLKRIAQSLGVKIQLELNP